MTDQEREEFELVAKACGFAGFHVDAGFNVSSDAEPCIWNPLTNDGDALRLVVKLGFRVRIDRIGGCVEVDIYDDGSWRSSLVEEIPGNDHEAATRIAIWTAAVAYARSLKND